MLKQTNQLKFGAMLSYLSIALDIIAGLVYTPWMVSTIGQSQYGLYTLARSLITLFLIDFGLSSATARYLSKYSAEGDTEGAERFLGAVYKLYLVIDAVIIIVLTVIFFLLDSIYVKLTPAELAQFKIVYVISAFFSVINFPFVTFNGILTAYEKFIPLKLADVIYRVLIVLFNVTALLMGGGLYALVMVNSFVGIISLLFKFIVIKRSIPIKPDFKHKDISLYKDIFGFSIWSTVFALSQRLIFNITPTVLGIVSSTAAISVFGIITTIEGYAYTITTAINGMFMPKIARIVTSDSAENELNSLLLSVGKYQYAINGLIFAGFAVVGRSFIELWMGAEYIEAYMGILLVLFPGLFYNSLQIANTALTVENKVKLQACVNTVTGLLNIVLSFPLSCYFGVYGACMSICIAYIFRAVAINIVSKRTLSLDIFTFVKKCYIHMSLPVILTILAGLLLNHLIDYSSWTVIILKAIIVSAVYLLLVFCIGIEKNDRAQIISFVKKKKG